MSGNDTGGKSYEEDLRELTELVDLIGDDECPMDELESRVKRAAELIKSLRDRLSATESTVTEVLAGLENREDTDQ